LQQGETIMAVAGLILGILSLVGGSIPVANQFPMWLFGVLGIILSAVARSKAKRARQPTGIATAGLVLSIIGTVFSFIFFLACAACVAGTVGSLGGFFNR
jgi:hypothetical protein